MKAKWEVIYKIFPSAKKKEEQGTSQDQHERNGKLKVYTFFLEILSREASNYDQGHDEDNNIACVDALALIFKHLVLY